MPCPGARGRRRGNGGHTGQSTATLEPRRARGLKQPEGSSRSDGALGGRASGEPGGYPTSGCPAGYGERPPRSRFLGFAGGSGPAASGSCRAVRARGARCARSGLAAARHPLAFGPGGAAHPGDSATSGPGSCLGGGSVPYLRFLALAFLPFLAFLPVLAFLALCFLDFFLPLGLVLLRLLLGLGLGVVCGGGGRSGALGRAFLGGPLLGGALGGGALFGGGEADPVSRRDRAADLAVAALAGPKPGTDSRRSRLAAASWPTVRIPAAVRLAAATSPMPATSVS